MGFMLIDDKNHINSVRTLYGKFLVDTPGLFAQRGNSQTQSFVVSLITCQYFFRLQEDPPAGVSGAPTDNNIMIWNAIIFG